MPSLLIGRHELRRPGQSGKWHLLEAATTKIETRPPVPIGKPLHEFRRARREAIALAITQFETEPARWNWITAIHGC